MPETGTVDTCGLTSEKNALKLLRLMNPSMKGLLMTDILVRFCEQIPYAFVVVWCMKIITEPVTALQFGALTTIEMTQRYLSIFRWPTLRIALQIIRLSS